MQSDTWEPFAWDPAHGRHRENTGFLPTLSLALPGVTAWTPLGLYPNHLELRPFSFFWKTCRGSFPSALLRIATLRNDSLLPL